MGEFKHTPVLPAECIEGLALRPGGVYADCTLGGGGHSELICEKLTGGRLIGLDRDEAAIAAAKKRLAKHLCFTAVKARFSELGEVMDRLGIAALDGVLFDLGVSSFQLDEASRGFSYAADAPLDMRMDPSSGVSAAEYLADVPEKELERVLREFGEERFSRQIAAAVVRARESGPVDTTLGLAALVRSAIPEKFARAEKQHPAKRSFQAIRIAINGELDEVEAGVRAAADKLAPGGRLCVITFHSLEDRIVKNIISEGASPCTCPKNFPVCTCGRSATLKKITGKPITASRTGLEENPRSRSAKLRVAEKLQ